MKKADLLGLPLDEAMDLMPDETIYVGSGTGFFFIGKKETSKEDIDGISEHWCSTYKRNFEKAKKNKAKWDKCFDKKNLLIEEADKIFPMKRDSSKRITEGFDHYRDRFMAKYQKISDNYTLSKKKHETFTPMNTRSVRDAYRTSGNDNLVLLVEGYESGYWFDYEYEEGRNGKSLHDPATAGNEEEQ